MDKKSMYRKRMLSVLIASSITGNSVIAQEYNEENQTDNDAIEEVVVTGIRASQAKAVDLKRNAKNVVDAIVAEDIGKLPDVTITDSLQRITGVQISREANEGTSLNVRGMPQVLTTLNGEQFLSPWNITGVGANYSDIPTGMISGVNVYKSQSSSIIAGGISGVVDLQTIRPLSLDQGFKSVLKLENSQGTRSNQEIQSDGTYENRPYDYNYSAFMGYNLDGAHAFTLAVTSSRSYAANYSMSENPRLMFLQSQNGRPSDPLDLDGDGDTQNDWYMAAENFGAKSGFLTRDRNGASLSIESEITDSLTFKGDVFYTKMDQYDRGVKIEYENKNSAFSWNRNQIPGTEAELYNALLPSTTLGDGYDLAYTNSQGEELDITVHSITNAEAVSSGFQSVSSNEIYNTAALNTNFQLHYDNADNVTVSVRYIYAKAEQRFRKAILAMGRPGWLWLDENYKTTDGSIVYDPDDERVVKERNDNDELIPVQAWDGKDPINPYPIGVDYSGAYPRFYTNSGGVTDDAIRATGIYQNNDGSDIFTFSRNISNAEDLTHYQAIAEGHNTEANLNILRADASYSFEDAGILQSVDFGARVGVRDAEYLEFDYVTATQTYETWNTRYPAEWRGKLRPGNEIWQRYPDWEDLSEESALQASDTVVFSDFGPFKGLEQGVAAINPSSWEDPLEFMKRLYPAPSAEALLEEDDRDLSPKTIADPANAYKVKETSSSLFGQINFEGEDSLWGIAYSGDFGIRILHTQRDVTRNIVPEVLDLFNSIGGKDDQLLALMYDQENKKKSFVQFLPSINLNLFPNDELVLRFGANRTTTRNDLKNVGSGLSLWYTECAKYYGNGDRVLVEDPNTGALIGDTVTCVGGGNESGNIDIKPWAATVFNSSAEWYFSENSILGLGVFYIDVDTSVQNFQETRSFLDGDGIDRNNSANVWVTSNVEASSLYGVELGYKQPFTFFPSVLGSTGIEFNYTYSESDSKVSDMQGDKLPLQSNSAHQTNMILWYDKGGLNVRVAYNWRSEEYQSYKEIDTSIGDALKISYWGEPVGYLDLSVSYEVFDYLKIFANGTNLTEEDRKSYAQFTDQFQSLYVQEARYSFGVNVSF